jgi:hypothetical protein
MIVARAEDNRRRLGVIAALIVAALAFAVTFSLASAPPASAQGLPSICDEYPNLPICEEPTGGGNNNPPGAGPTAEQGVSTGELPFTGYPLTPLLLLLLLLLLLGMALRAYVEIRDRIRPDADGDGPLGLG